MRASLLHCALLVVCLGGFEVTAQVTSSKDGSILQPTDVSYVEAMKFAQFLNHNGIKVDSIHLSKLNGLFAGLKKAAFFRTDKGIVEVIFFPESTQAENVKVTERRINGRYLYSFEGVPNGDSISYGFDAFKPMYFLMHGNWFILPESETFYDLLKRRLKVE